MNLQIPQIIRDYIDASNSHDVEGILVCFSDNATVRDENETLHGKQSIKGWIIRTIEKYQFHFEPLKIQHDDDEATVAVKVSGTFPGSPSHSITISPSTTTRFPRSPWTDQSAILCSLPAITSWKLCKGTGISRSRP